MSDRPGENSADVSRLVLLITHEIHAARTDRGFYNRGGVIGYDALCNYLHTLSRAVAVLRCRPADRAQAEWLRVDGPGVCVHPIPEAGSLKGLLSNGLAIIRQIRRGIRRADRFIIRLPGPCGSMVGLMLLLSGRGYGVELVGSAREGLDLLARGRGSKRSRMSSIADRVTRLLVGKAVAVGYRSDYLRRLYPNRRPGRQWIFSGAQLMPQAITAPRTAGSFSDKPFQVISVGRLTHEKGHAVLLDGFARARTIADVPMALTVVGDGPERPGLVEQAERLGIDEVCHLPGRVAWGAELLAHLDRAHVFVLPSLTEGMPRALIEAFARGLAALGSDVGGIPELLDEPDLFPPGDAEALGGKLARLAGDASTLAAMSLRNFEKSKEHWPDAIDRAKTGFWNAVVRWAK